MINKKIALCIISLAGLNVLEIVASSCPPFAGSVDCNKILTDPNAILYCIQSRKRNSGVGSMDTAEMANIYSSITDLTGCPGLYPDVGYRDFTKNNALVDVQHKIVDFINSHHIDVGNFSYNDYSKAIAAYLKANPDLAKDFTTYYGIVYDTKSTTHAKERARALWDAYTSKDISDPAELVYMQNAMMGFGCNNYFRQHPEIKQKITKWLQDKYLKGSGADQGLYNVIISAIENNHC